MDERLSTGLDALDRQFAPDGDDEGEDGGIPAGSLVALEVPVGAMYEPLLWGMADEERTVYLSTLRSERAVAGDLRAVDPDPEYRVHEVGFEDPARSAADAIELVDWQAYVVLDTANVLERTVDRARYAHFLDELDDHLDATGGVAVLVVARTESIPDCREYTLTVADVVWDLETRVHRSAVEHFLHVRKFRGGHLPEEMVKLDLGETVTVDTSRDIA